MALPIDPLLPAIVAALRAGPAVVIEAPPGAGKTTRVPRALLEAGIGDGEIVVLQPRRLPARLAARRVAEEMGETAGGRVGYTVRFEDVSGPATRLRFVTEGVLTRRLLDDPTLRGVSAIVLDEFHERHLHADLGLAMLRALQRGARPDLKIAVMSATLEADPVCAYLGGAPSLRSEGRRFDVAIEYAERADDRPLAQQVAGAVRRALLDGAGGDVLVFLPGAGEIRRAAEALEPLGRERSLAVLPLHGELPPSEQDRAVRPAADGRRKVILSTNVAETSVTIEGVAVVVDSGLARIASHSPWSGLPVLAVGKVSQSSAVQRAGRAGRTRPGRTIRLYTRHDFESRRAHDLPEVKRLDLAEALLALHAAGVRDARAFEWFEAPPEAALAAAGDLLVRLGAVLGDGGLTDVGRRMLRFPLHPRLARVVVEGHRLGVGDEACLGAALVSERDVRERARPTFGGGGPRDGGETSDLLAVLDRVRQARSARFDRGRMRGLGLDPRAVESVDRAAAQLRGSLERSGAGRRPGGPDQVDRALARSMLAGFPDRVGRRRKPGGGGIVLSGGGSAEVPVAQDGEWMVAIDVEERTVAVRSTVAVRLACAIDPAWLLDQPGEALGETDELVWNDGTERVDRVRRILYGALPLDETREPAPPSPEASRLLAAAAGRQRAGRAAAGLGSGDHGDLAALGGKLAFLREAFPEAGVPPLDPADLGGLLATACDGRTSLAELRAAGLPALLVGSLPPGVQALLRREAPDRLRLGGGREVHVHYDAGKPPWIESSLQDFFGSERGPALAAGRVPITLHLLAPNGRAVQVTRDLAGFWTQHYPALRRELGRRYPRHAWPEDARRALPPPPRPPRRG